MRSTRYMFARRCPTSAARVMMVIPIFSGEAGSGLKATVHVRSLPNVGNAFQFIGPNGAIEYNFYAMYSPYHVVSTFTGGVSTNDSNLSDQGVHDLPHPPASTAEWDAFFRRLILEFGSDGNEFYGANPDDSGAQYDAVRNMWVRRRGGADTKVQTVDPTPGTALEASDSAEGDRLSKTYATDEPLTMGPRGIARLYSRETILTSDSVSALGREVSGLTSIFSSAGVNDLVYSDTFEIDIAVPVSGPGYVLLGCVRMAVDETEGFSASYAASTPGSGTIEALRNRALNMLLGQDQERVQWLISQSTSVEADYIRSLLFGGDNYLEDAGAYTPIDFYEDGSWFRPNEIVLTGKVFTGTHTPYMMKVV